MVRVYSESASAWAGGRQTELARCIRDGEHHHFDTIVCWPLDRVSREAPLRVLSLIEHLRKRGIKLVSVQEGWSETAGEFAPVLFGITAWIASWESKRKSERTKAGLAQKRLNGVGKHGKDRKPRHRRWLKRPVLVTPDWMSVDTVNN